MRNGFYFTRVTAAADRHYYPASPALLDALLAAADDPIIADIAGAYRDLLGIDLFAELRRGPGANAMRASQVQIGIYAALARVLELRLGPPAVIGCYSSGALAAFVYLRVLSPRECMSSVGAFAGNLIVQIERLGRANDLYQVLLRGGMGDDLQSAVADVLSALQGPARLFVKDRRQARQVLLAGHADELRIAQIMLARRFPGRGLEFAEHQRVNAAHLPLLDRAAAAAHLDPLVFRPPRIALVGTAGEEVERGCSDALRLRRVFVDACSAPMNTGASLAALEQRCDRLLIIGSRRSARVLGDMRCGMALELAGARHLEREQD